MKNRKFLFKFIDHDNGSVQIAEFDIHCNKKTEWTHDENNINEHVIWMTRHIKWECLLKKKIKEMVKERYPNLVTTTGQTRDHLFGDYKLCKEKMCKEKETVNLAKTADEPKRFRVVELMEKHVFKFERGTKPNDWSQVFDYNKFHKLFEYYLSDDDTENIILVPLQIEGNGIIISPHNGTNSATITRNNARRNTTATGLNMNTSAVTTGMTNRANGENYGIVDLGNPTQFGGHDYAEKYYKYKKKYIEGKRTSYK